VTLPPLPALPCSKAELARVGDRMAAGMATAADLDIFALALEAYDQRRSLLQQALAVIPWQDIFHRPIALSVSGRTKSIDTLLEKLRRSPTLKLPTIQDVAGVRIVGPMTLADQDGLAKGVAGAFQAVLHPEGPAPRVVDRRAKPIAGYRAVHVIGRMGGLPIEVQIRTEMQATWADVYEKFADVFGRPLRYLSPDELTRIANAADPEPTTPIPGDVAQLALELQAISTDGIAEAEKLLPILAVAEADLDRTVTVEGRDVKIRDVAEIVEGQRAVVVKTLQGIMDKLQPLQSEATPDVGTEGGTAT
jgi:ppGpp synthetase/RelA/SpoT-type nucleotidyltranferase